MAHDPASRAPSLKQLHYLLALDDTRSFRKAAERCGISQPSLSVQIANLEERLGLRLISRGRGPVTLTVAGREVVARARRIWAEVTALQGIAPRLGTGLIGTVRLGVSTTLGPYFLPHAVGRLHRANPELKLYVREAAPRVLVEQLDRGDHDLLLTQLPVVGTDYTTVRLFREALFMVTAQSHTLAGRAEIAETDLAGVSVLSLGPGYALHEQVSALCEAHGARLLHDYEGTSLDALRVMTAMGMGVCLLPALYIRSEIGSETQDLAVVPFRGSRVARSLGLVWRRTSGNDRIAESLCDAFRDAVRDLAIPGVRVET